VPYASAAGSRASMFRSSSKRTSENQSNPQVQDVGDDRIERLEMSLEARLGKLAAENVSLEERVQKLEASLQAHEQVQ